MEEVVDANETAGHSGFASTVLCKQECALGKKQGKSTLGQIERRNDGSMGWTRGADCSCIEPVVYGGGLAGLTVPRVGSGLQLPQHTMRTPTRCPSAACAALR
mmetsp:Transcript_42279/g.113076  ORF Transcript_42279/g.113076 Transcript_42279/m.113076 type:complete len:103 (+) Transcript_42279:207-515(+)